MATISRTVQWTLLADIDTVLDLLPPAIEKATFKLASLSPEQVLVDVPRAILRDRWAAKITGKMTPANDKTFIDWRVEGLGNRHYEHLVKIAEGLPEDLLDDHGIKAAASQDYLRLFGWKEIAHLANVLEREEHVHAIGVGLLDNKNGIAAVTSRRLLFLEKSIGSESLTSFSINGIQAVDVKKASMSLRSSGETLTISHLGTTAIISKLAHGQGDSLLRAIRGAQESQAASAQPAAQGPVDTVGQLERLAELFDRGVLTQEEFQQQKRAILQKS
ncbi:SHOCT domain-containing protein [Sinomonas atrocyanea]|uniref:SHOCT domain-containing protein n=1 Tax=Sinomonas atrocyanea TaxID=37927 RepID=UPI0027800AE8|nr:SHOCT domain-containing protein [Sinomonas atrocyanea]MDQ0259519.1 hypothetical protein [Sinomonas atrocyanea]MDR6623338.1 hypothetical protein [Sinomonas atrocyanea]